MGVENDTWRVLILPPVPAAAPSYTYPQKENNTAGTEFDNTVNAVSFGFVATAVLISMFLAMAIFEKFLRATDTRRRTPNDIESQTTQFNFHHKFRYPSPKAFMEDAPVISVVMPGDNVPTYLANPVPCGESGSGSTDTESSKQ